MEKIDKKRIDWIFPRLAVFNKFSKLTSKKQLNISVGIPIRNEYITL